MRFLKLLVAGPLLTAGVTFAQGFNVDVGTFNAVPSASFGAAASQPGVWNQVGALTVGGSATLVDLAGTATAVTMTLTSGAPPTLFNFDNTGTLAGSDDELLMDDAVDPGTATTAVYTISGLSAGIYDVYTYAWAPDSTTYFSNVSVNGLPSQFVGGAWPGGYTLGVTHALHTVTITAGQNIVMSMFEQTTFATFNGIQIKPIGTPSTVFCSGNVVGTTCLACGNNGSVGRGCANSSFASGTLLGTTGNASVGADTLTLVTTDMTGPGLFFQANSLAGSPISFGDGELCAAVGILRLGVVFPVSGSATYPGGLTPNPITVGGGPIAAGNTKHYQVWYRDAAAFCTTSTFNTSNGVSLTWTP